MRYFIAVSLVTVALVMAWFFTSLPLGKVLAAGELQGLDWEKADAETLRLPPSAFPELPASIARDLERRGCLIPQVEPRSTVLDNVISGQFRKPGQTDWAVLCSIDRVSSLLVFWNGSAKDVEIPKVKKMKWDKMPDLHALQTIGDRRIGFSHQIGPVGKKWILQYYAWSGGPKPPPIDHEGIDFYFVGKASTVLYWYKGEWLRLTGAD